LVRIVLHLEVQVEIPFKDGKALAELAQVAI
jgi:hypothetical protein